MVLSVDQILWRFKELMITFEIVSTQQTRWMTNTRETVDLWILICLNFVEGVISSLLWPGRSLFLRLNLNNLPSPPLLLAVDGAKNFVF